MWIGNARKLCRLRASVFDCLSKSNLNKKFQGLKTIRLCRIYTQKLINFFFSSSAAAHCVRQSVFHGCWLTADKSIDVLISLQASLSACRLITWNTFTAFWRLLAGIPLCEKDFCCEILLFLSCRYISTQRAQQTVYIVRELEVHCYCVSNTAHNKKKLSSKSNCSAAERIHSGRTNAWYFTHFLRSTTSSPAN